MKAAQHHEYVTIGKVLKTRGVRGEVKVLSLTGIPDRFEHLSSVSVCLANHQVQQVKIEQVSYYKNFVYLRFQGYDSVEKVAHFIGCALQVDGIESPTLPEGVYYHFEIIDSEVYTDENRYLGKVVEILETGGHDVYVVRDGAHEYLIPSTQEVVTTIDRKKRRITIHPLEGLLEL